MRNILFLTVITLLKYILYISITKIAMLNQLNYSKNNLLHIQQEYLSSSESLQFIHDLLQAFHQDVSQTMHTRRAELKTITTEAGRSLRNTVLAMHSTLASQILEHIAVYGEVGQWVKARCNNIGQTVKEVQMCVGEYQDTMGFLKSKEKKIEMELDRLNKKCYEIHKKQHLNNLKQQYKLQLSYMSSSSTSSNTHSHNRSTSTPQPNNLPNLHNKISTYTAEYRQVMQYMYGVLYRVSNKIDAFVPKLEALQKQLAEFAELYRILEIKNRPQGSQLNNKLRHGTQETKSKGSSNSLNSRKESLKGNNRYGEVRDSSKMGEEKKDSMDLQNWRQYFSNENIQKQNTGQLKGRKAESINSQQSDSLLLK